MSFRHKQARRSEAGNVFFALFGTIVLLGVLGATVSGFIKGPLTSSIKVTRDSVADTQMSMIAQVIVMQSATQTACDADADVEPIAWRLASSLPAPTGGGLVPLSLGVATTADPWGTQYGYCTWDHGADDCGGVGRLAGTAVNPDSHTVIALVSAGPDKTFSTTCRTFAAADVDADGNFDPLIGANDATDLPMVSKSASTDDDIIYTYSVSQATGASGGVGLWAIKSTDANVATIDKNIDVTGGAIFSGAGEFAGITTDSVAATAADAIDFMQGFRVPDASTFTDACDDDLQGVMRRNGSSLELCLNDVWTAATGGGGSGGGLPGFTPDASGVCDSSTLGDIRYNTGTSLIEYCNGSSWRSLSSQSSSPVALSISPTVATGMNATGPCFSLYCPYAYGAIRQFVVTNIGTGTSGALDLGFMGPNINNFQVDDSQTTCDGATLAPGAKCIVAVRPRADGNFSYNASFVLSISGTPQVAAGLSGTGSGFTCGAGMRGWGGIVLTCTDSTTPDYIINEPGCPISTLNEPTCGADGALDPQMSAASGSYWPSIFSQSGAQNTADFFAYGPSGMAYTYCSQFTKGGYSDWFVPSAAEYESVISMFHDVLSMDGVEYWTSNSSSGAWAGADNTVIYVKADRRANYPIDGGDTRSVRCLRRHGVALPTANADTNVDLYSSNIEFTGELSLDIGHTFAQSSSQVMASPQLNVRSITTAIPVSVTGPGSPTVSINGAAGVASGTVRLGDIIVINGTGPATTGTETAFKLHLGDKTYQWMIYYPPAVTAQIFVTNGVWNGNRGGIGGADTQCQNAAVAAGLSGNWYAVVANGPTETHPKDRLPWAWDRLENRGGEFVARNINDLLDNTLSSPIRYNESGVLAPSKKVWSGLYSLNEALYINDDGNGNCVGWTSNSASYTAPTGDSGSTSWGAFSPLSSWDGCNQTRSFYCMGPF